jgi:hypothetical protein
MEVPVKGEAFLKYLWSLQPPGHHFLVLRQGGRWREVSIDPMQQLDRIVGAEKADLYFCPNSFSDCRREKTLVLTSRVMYQDLDEVAPDECPLRPEWWWETSPGRYQAVWILDSVLEPQEFAAYNKALNRACGADPGTWNLTRVLRVPGSYNAKRKCYVSEAYEYVAAVA